MRMKRFSSVLFLSASLALIGAGCDQKASVSTDTPPQERPSTTTSNDSCNNPYLAFRPGLTVAYSVEPKGVGAGDSDYTTKIVSVSGDIALVRTEMENGRVSNMQINCKDGSMVDTQDQKFKVTRVSSSGTFMPPNVKAGSTWSNTQTLKMEPTDESDASFGAVLFTTTEQGRVVAEESITVQAGTYKAIKVELTQIQTDKLVGAKLDRSPPSTLTFTEWRVKGIGMVKTVTKNQDVTSTVEAKSITGL